MIIAEYGQGMYKNLERFGDSFDIIKDHKALIGEVLTSYQELNGKLLVIALLFIKPFIVDFCKYSTSNGTEYLAEIGSRYMSFYPPGRRN